MADQQWCERHGVQYTPTPLSAGKYSAHSGCPACAQEVIAAAAKEDLQHRARAIADNEKLHQKKVAQKRFSRTGIPPRFTSKQFDNYLAEGEAQQYALRQCREYADRLIQGGHHGCLILTGNPGTGKTHLACAIGNALTAAGGNVLFISVSQMIRKIREAYLPAAAHTEQQLIDGFRDLDLLILDEVGIQKGNDAELHLFFEVMNERYSHLKPTILLSNLSVREINALLGSRVLDRMREDGGQVVAFPWQSARGNPDLQTVGGGIGHER